MLLQLLIDFYLIDSKVEEVGRALGLAGIGLDKDVSELSGGQRTKVLLGKLLLESVKRCMGFVPRRLNLYRTNLAAT